MAPPSSSSSDWPRVSVISRSFRMPPAPTSKKRNCSALAARAMVEPLPLIVMGWVISGSPLPSWLAVRV
jgi:hypothetical protein